MTRAGTWVLLAIFSLACASTPYPYGRDLESDLALKLRSGEPQLERGRPHALVDGLGHYLFSLPAKLLLLNWKIDNHDISGETESSIFEYLRANGLCNVKVRLNQYAPGDEWRRLARNREMPGAWRWTLGVLTVANYTILPERLLAGLFGGDHYNPFTNTISLYSDSRAIALHEAGHSKDFASKRNRHWKGGYAALRVLPMVPLWQEYAGSTEAISWERARGGGNDEKAAYRVLYPAYGTYLGGEAVRWYGPGWIAYAAVVPGHIVGWIRSLWVKDRERPELDAAIRLELEEGCPTPPQSEADAEGPVGESPSDDDPDRDARFDAPLPPLDAR